ncbi:FkbM family methyltransferase [Christiangramia echinicola]|uniref:FkbM family methyltransferase n=1 Tax=Christiangramia echinicola TaxID=279359 RepID=UPI00041E9657|nr:FkbM family methyltransferase [Christiangramia echinicola]
MSQVLSFNKVKLKSFLKRIKYYILQRVYATPSKEQLRSFIDELKPVKTNFNLIRLGGELDGGYLIPDDLIGVNVCFSAGVGPSSDFEKDCADRGMKIYMADASVSGPAIKDERFNFIKKFIGPKNRKDFITLEKWVSSTKMDSENELLLQMDIEGHEYAAIAGLLPELLKKFRVIILEVHRLGAIGFPYFYQQNKTMFDKLNLHHQCVHIHPNNCCGVRTIKGLDVPVAAEFTFLRKDRISKIDRIEGLPHPLDRKNIARKENLDLSEIWYR